jgi:hypothetical protein
MKFSDRLPDAFDDEEPDPDLERELDESFPLGDGTADTDAVVACPHCGESVEIALDPGSGAIQEYVEDCEVCCQPWRVSVAYDETGAAHVSVTGLES